MGMYTFATQDSRLSARVRFLEKGSLRLRRGSVVGRFVKTDLASIDSILVQDLSKVGKAQFSAVGKRTIGIVTS